MGASVCVDTHGMLTVWTGRFARAQDRAKLALKVKKFKEQQMKQADEHLLTVLEMLDTVEWETQQLKVFEGLKAGNSILNAIHQEMSVEAVENLMLETEEAQETANVRLSSNRGDRPGRSYSRGCGAWRWRLTVRPWHVCGHLGVTMKQEISRLIGGSLTLEDEDAVLLELAEIEALEAEKLAFALPEAPVAVGATSGYMDYYWLAGCLGGWVP